MKKCPAVLHAPKSMTLALPSTFYRLLTSSKMLKAWRHWSLLFCHPCVSCSPFPSSAARPWPYLASLLSNVRHLALLPYVLLQELPLHRLWPGEGCCLCHFHLRHLHLDAKPLARGDGQRWNARLARPGRAAETTTKRISFAYLYVCLSSYLYLSLFNI